MIAAALIDQARDYHPAFAPEKIPAVMALRALSRLERDLTEALVAESEEVAAEAVVYTPEQIAAALAAGGLELPAHYLVLGVRARFPRGEAEVKLVSYADQQSLYVFHPSACLLGQKLVLTDTRELGVGASGWEEVEALRVTLVRRPEPLAHPKQALTLSPLAEDALVRQLALWMAGRAGVLAELPRLPEEAQASAERFLSMLADQGSTSLHRVVRTEG